MKIMITDKEKFQIIEWAKFYLCFSKIWEESDTHAYTSLLLSLRYKTALYLVQCREFLKWGWFYMENSPDYDSDKEFFVFNCILRMFNENQLINIAKHVLPVARPIPFF